MENIGNNISSEFWIKLEDKYKSLPSGAKEWESEKKSLEKIIEILQKEVSFRYEIIEPLGVGGIGIVLKVLDKNLNIPSAIKFPRPKTGKESLFAEIVKSEISQLLQVRHPNIIEIYYQKEVQFNETKIPYYIMEYLPEAEDALEYFSKEPRKRSVLLDVLYQIICGIEHLHKLNIVHLDIKLENMLISSDGRALISDLGSARNLLEGSDTTLIIFTREYAHPGLISNIASTSTDINRVRAEIRRSELKKSFDLFALGKNIQRILKLHEPRKWKDLDPYSRKYLDLMADRLLDGKNIEDKCALGLPSKVFSEIKYVNISEVSTDIKKLTGEYSLYQNIPEMNEHGIQTIQTSVLSPTTFTPRLGAIIKHPIFRRLCDVSQLGLINLIYPTATHSRLEHVLGTFSNVVRYCNALYHDPINPLFRQIMNDDDLKAILLSALFHDIGQYPLAHDLEEAESVIFSHEDITIEMLEKQFNYLELPRLKKLILDQWNISPQRVINIIKADPNKLNCSIKDRISHTIIDGPIDADKIDYLVRDSVNLNVPFGKAIDFERFLHCLTIIFKEQGGKLYVALGIHEKGKTQAETVAFIRYAMFGTVYWHHTSRALKAMLHRAVWESLSLLKQKEDIKQFQSNFRMFIFEGIEERQITLYPLETTLLPSTTQLTSSDRKMLEWLAEYNTQAGKELIKMINNRDLYKRILVVSEKKNSPLWHELIKFRNDFNQKKIVDLQKKIQNEVIQLIQTTDDLKQRTISVLEPTVIEKVISLAEKGTVLILVDIPIERSGSTINLEYLPEADRQEMLELWKEPIGLEDSVIWKQLHDSFLESTGKIRVFCHPDIADTVRAAISKSELESLIEAAIQYVRKGK